MEQDHSCKALVRYSGEVRHDKIHLPATFSITAEILNQVAGISEAIERLTVLIDEARALRLRRIDRIRTIHGSLAIKGTP